MESLAGKLTNLSYEIFGIFAPGIIGIVFLMFFWWTLGSYPHELSGGFLPSISYEVLRQQKYNSFDLIFLLVAAYFVGHMLFWLARKHGESQESPWRRVLSCLRFRVPRPAASFDPHLTPMLVVVAERLGISNDDKIWARFFPIAKVMLAHQLTRSLVSTYQNKYTLHRSITAAASLLFWSLIVSGMIMGAVTIFPVCFVSPEPRWAAMMFGVIASVALVWGFSDSFAYNWKMFGNSVITESFALMSGAVSARTTNE